MHDKQLLFKGVHHLSMLSVCLNRKHIVIFFWINMRKIVSLLECSLQRDNIVLCCRDLLLTFVSHGQTLRFVVIIRPRHSVWLRNELTIHDRSGTNNCPYLYISKSVPICSSCFLSGGRCINFSTYNFMKRPHDTRS